LITVWSVCNGTKYTDNDVHILRDMVARNINQPHRFRCLADREIAGVDTFIPDEQWPGWWSKLLLFRYSTGQCLYLDLDVVITGPLDGLISLPLSMPANWAQSGHGGCQSSVMSWGMPYHAIPDAFNVDELGPAGEGGCGRYRGLWGDQELITELYGNPGWQIRDMQGIYSYKYHCKQGLPAGAKVVCFHGQPKPQDVSDAWVSAARSSMPMAS
jgi:hypothetical protein